MYTNSETNSSDHIGFPVTEAVWRTNHGYDPIIREHYEWSQSPTSWSMQRYVMIHEAITSYERNGISVGPMEAINITAIVGDKGHHAYDCMDVSRLPWRIMPECRLSFFRIPTERTFSALRMILTIRSW